MLSCCSFTAALKAFLRGALRTPNTRRIESAAVGCNPRKFEELEEAQRLQVEDKADEHCHGTRREHELDDVELDPEEHEL